MGLAKDMGGLVVAGVGVKLINNTISKGSSRWKKNMKGWRGESERHRMAKYGIKTGRNKVKVVMKEFKQHKLHSGSGKIVTSRKQAVAIALSEQRKYDKRHK